MSNPFDNKIKESLENFEMPYDANAWAQFEKQLPKSGGAATGSSQLGWKIAAIFAVVATVVTTVWYLNSTDAPKQADTVATQHTEPVEKETVIRENSSSPVEPTVVPKKLNPVDRSDKPQVADATAADEIASDSDNESVKWDTKPMAKTTKADTQNEEQKAAPTAKKTTTEKTEAQPLVAAFAASALKVCVGEDVGFINETSDLKAKMVWNFGDGTSSNELNPTHSYGYAGDYSVTLRASNESKAAERTISVKVNPVPTATLDASQKLPGYEAIPFYHFETLLLPGETAVWKFSDGSTIQGTVADRLFRDAGNVSATLTVKNTSGCTHSDNWKSENRKAFDLIAPNTFTPDGNGSNEAFIPGALPDMGVDFEMLITDLKGQEVYRTSNPSEPWNGKMHNTGVKLEPGTYAWTVVLKEEILNKKTFSGTIKLIR